MIERNNAKGWVITNDVDMDKGRNNNLFEMEWQSNANLDTKLKGNNNIGKAYKGIT